MVGLVENFVERLVHVNINVLDHHKFLIPSSNLFLQEILERLATLCVNQIDNELLWELED